MDLVYDFSFDPGTNRIAYCQWLGGKPIDLQSVNVPSGLEHSQKILWQKRWLTGMFVSICDHGDLINRIAVEVFEYHHKAKDIAYLHAGKESMMKCSSIQGMLFAVADDYCKTVIPANKKQIKKAETALLARGYGLAPANKDEADAFQVGVVAGFDRPLRATP